MQAGAGIVVCIPTRNEEDNVEELLNLILNENIPRAICLEKTSRAKKRRIKISANALKVLFINDHSTDRTRKRENALAVKHKGRVFVIDNLRPAGIGNAYLSGFEYALESLHAALLFEMDGDLSHSPKYIPAFLKAIVKNDIVIGSRYIRGGASVGWPLRRRIISRAANLLNQLSTCFKIRDATSGYRLYREEAAKAVLKAGKAGMPGGYAFQVSALSAALKNRFLIAEIPIIFEDRKAGVSKLSKEEIKEFLSSSLHNALRGNK
jgi:dolichol-phosphate mannosyltransferase